MRTKVFGKEWGGAGSSRRRVGCHVQDFPLQSSFWWRWEWPGYYISHWSLTLKLWDHVDTCIFISVGFQGILVGQPSIYLREIQAIFTIDSQNSISIIHALASSHAISAVCSCEENYWYSLYMIVSHCWLHYMFLLIPCMLCRMGMAYINTVQTAKANAFIFR